MKLKVKYIQFAKWLDTQSDNIKIAFYNLISSIAEILAVYIPLMVTFEDIRKNTWLIIILSLGVTFRTISNIYSHKKLKLASKTTEISYE